LTLRDSSAGRGLHVVHEKLTPVRLRDARLAVIEPTAPEKRQGMQRQGPRGHTERQRVASDRARAAATIASTRLVDRVPSKYSTFSAAGQLLG